MHLFFSLGKRILSFFARLKLDTKTLESSGRIVVCVVLYQSPPWHHPKVAQKRSCSHLVSNCSSRTTTSRSTLAKLLLSVLSRSVHPYSRSSLPLFGVSYTKAILTFWLLHPCQYSLDGSLMNLRDWLPTLDPEKGIDKSITNILKLHFLAGGDIDNKRNNVPGQICLYHRGCGGISSNPFVQIYNLARGNLRQQTVPMRKMLENVYEKGDTIYIIGFSRGAASARKFITELESDGLLTASGELIQAPPIEFLGCFDTVSMQLSWRFASFNLKTHFLNRITRSRILGEKGGAIPSIVKKAVHLVALDDNRFRLGFSPVYMDSADDRVHEIWVAGEHGDCGGQWFTKGMPDCSCKCMQEFLEEAGLTFLSNHEIDADCLKLDKDPTVQIDKKFLDIAPDPSDKIHALLPVESFRPVTTVTNEQIIQGGTVRIHVSVLQHMEAMEKLGTPYKFNPGLNQTELVVVGPLDKPLEAETKRFKELITVRQSRLLRLDTTNWIAVFAMVLISSFLFLMHPKTCSEYINSPNLVFRQWMNEWMNPSSQRFQLPTTILLKPHNNSNVRGLRLVKVLSLFENVMFLIDLSLQWCDFQATETPW